MALKFFLVPIVDSGAAEEKINTFLNSHTVLSVDRQWVSHDGQAYYAFCIDYMPGGVQTRTVIPGRGGSSKPKVDYREVLTPEQFTVYCKLRDLRKEIAEAETTPVYTVFSNAQLAEMVTSRVDTKTALANVSGVGEGRVAKHGERFLEALAAAWGAIGEAEGEPVRDDPEPAEPAPGDGEGAEGQAAA